MQIPGSIIMYAKGHKLSQSKAPRLEEGLFDLSKGGRVYRRSERVIPAVLRCNQVGSIGRYHISAGNNSYGFYISASEGFKSFVEITLVLPVEVEAIGMFSPDWRSLTLELLK